MSSIPRWDAASISITSSEVPPAIVTHAWQVLSGVGVGPCTQFSALARIRAIEVLPVPRGPAKRYACRTCPAAIAFLSVRTTASCPTTSSKSCGRYFRYSAVTLTIQAESLRRAPVDLRHLRDPVRRNGRAAGRLRDLRGLASVRRLGAVRRSAERYLRALVEQGPAAQPASKRLPREEPEPLARAGPDRGT